MWLPTSTQAVVILVLLLPVCIVFTIAIDDRNLHVIGQNVHCVWSVGSSAAVTSYILYFSETVHVRKVKVKVLLWKFH